MANPKLEVLTPQNCQLIFIDQQPQMAFGVQSIDRQVLVALAKAAKVFNIPTTITTVETQSFSGYTNPELRDVFPDHKLLERTSMNVREHSGAYGIGVDYAYTMVHKTPQRTSKLHEVLAPVPA
jgi:hypothetical protein